MGIIEDRKKRASEFISVRHVMMAMSQHSGVSVGEVAGEFIYHFDLPGENPAFYRQDPATLVMSESDGVFMRAILNTIVRWGRLDWHERSLPTPSDLDEFGWNRHDIGTYLLVFMGHLPDCCDPDWEAIEETNSPKIALCQSAHVCVPGNDQQGDLLSTGNCGNVDRYEWLDHPLFPEELSIAITAWNAAVVSSEQAGKRPGEFIREWLKENNPGLKNEAVNRIATVANWEKIGGRAKKIR